jgi:hypothetical protein
MAVDLREFFKATDPGKTLVVENPEDKKLYIDFSSVRGGKLIEELKDNITIEEPRRLKELLQGAVKVLNSEVTGVKLKVPGVGDVGVTSETEKFSLAFGIGEITTKAKSDATLRGKLNQYLGPQKTQLLDAINKEQLEPAIAKLKQLGKKGLVVIVDNLDRIDNRQKAWGRPQQEYLFVDQGESWFDINPILAEAKELR